MEAYVTYQHTFLPGGHDRWICEHILSGVKVTDPVEHTDHPDGSVTVEYPMEEPAVLAAIAGYTPQSYEGKPPPFDTLSPTEAAALPPDGPLAVAKAILAKEDSDITAGEVKTLVLIMARFLLKKILAGWR